MPLLTYWPSQKRYGSYWDRGWLPRFESSWVLLLHSYSRDCKLPRYQDAKWYCSRWTVLAGPWWRKLLQCIPCLLWYDVIQWRMDHVLHHWWIRKTQKWSDVQPWFPLWSGRVQNKLQQYSCKLNVSWAKMTPPTKSSQFFLLAYS